MRSSNPGSVDGATLRAVFETSQIDGLSGQIRLTPGNHSGFMPQSLTMLRPRRALAPARLEHCGFVSLVAKDPSRREWGTAMRRYRALLVSVLATALIGAAGGCTSSKAEPAAAGEKKLDKVTYLTAFGAVGRDAFAWVAQEKGYFKESGLDVTIQLGAADGREPQGPRRRPGAVRRPGPDRGLDPRRQGRLQGLPDHRRDPPAVTGLDRDAGGIGITSPKDLEGKKVGAATGSVNQLLFPAYAKLAGIDATKVQWVNAQPPQLPGAAGRRSGPGAEHVPHRLQGHREGGRRQEGRDPALQQVPR